MDAYTSGTHPWQPVVVAWMEKIRLSHKVKKEKFQDTADKMMSYYNGPYDFMYNLGPTKSAFLSEGTPEFPAPSWRMKMNKCAELVQIFGPTLYHKNPVRKVNPTEPALIPIEAFGDPNDPTPIPMPGVMPGMPVPPGIPTTMGEMLQQQYSQIIKQNAQLAGVSKARAVLMEKYLDYTPGALDLKTHSRHAIVEALVKGMGVLWTEPFRSAGGNMTLVGSFYDTINNYIADGDAEREVDIKFKARRCCKPYWEVEKEQGLPAESLKKYASLESYDQQSSVNADADGDYKRKIGQTNDLIVYWKIWSKMGMGGRLRGVSDDIKALDLYGDFVYLVICEKCPYLLNVPQQAVEMQDMEAIQKALEWPTPFWRDDYWPCTLFYFHSVPNTIWPASHISFATGELEFLNWAYTFLMQKIKNASRDFICIAKSAGEELKKTIQVGQDYSYIEVDAIHQSIDNMVKFLQHPGFNPEIWRIIEGVNHQFEQRTGLTELVYGMSARQMRSAEEAQVKGDQMSVRPDDMANMVEDAMSEIAEKEAFAARWHVTDQDVLPIMGPQGAQWWQQFVMMSDPAEIIDQLQYRIEAGSARKPNKAREHENFQQAMQVIFQPLYQYATVSGDVGPINAVIAGWCKSQDMEPGPFLLKPPPPPPPPGPGGPSGPPSGGGPPPGPK